MTNHIWAAQLASGRWIVVLKESETVAPYYRERRGPFREDWLAKSFCSRMNAKTLDATVKNK